ncbi:MAG: DUF998 domain-containing protein [Actinomycetes bacterium]
MGAALSKIAVGGCLLLLVSVVVGGAVNDGYAQTRDYVSALSGRGSTAAFVGMVGLLGFSAAHAAAGLVFRQRSRTAFVGLELAAVSGVVVAFARIQCPQGAAGCSRGDGIPPDALDRVHGFGVVAYELCFIVGVVAAGWWLMRASKAVRVRAWAVALFALVVTSAALLAAMPDDSPGMVQRMWLSVNSLAIIGVALAGSRHR